MEKTKKINQKQKIYDSHKKFPRAKESEFFNDSDLETGEPYRRLIPVVPMDTSNGESLRRAFKKALNWQNYGEREVLTDFECFSASDYDSEKESFESEYDLDKLSSDIKILSQDLVKDMKESSADEGDSSWGKTKPDSNLPSDGISGVSDLELASDYEEPKFKGRNLKVVNAVCNTHTDVEELSGDERKQKGKPCTTKSTNSVKMVPSTDRWIKSRDSSEIKTAERMELTEEEQFSDSSESEEELGLTPDRVLTPVKSLGDSCGIVTEKIRKLQPPEDISKGVPRIVVSYFDSSDKTPSGKLNTEDAKESSNVTEAYSQKQKGNCRINHERREKPRNKISRKQEGPPEKIIVQPAKRNEKPSECTFLTPKSAERKKKKTKKTREMEEKVVATDVEELVSDNEQQQQILEGGQTDLEDLGFLSDSEMENDDDRENKMDGTELEDFEGSSEDGEESMEFEATAADLDDRSLVHIQNRIQSNWDCPEEAIHMKNYVESTEVHTDVENLELSEQENPGKAFPGKYFGNFENVSFTSKSNFSTLVTVGGRRDFAKVRCLEQKREKRSTKKREEAFKEWSEKGQSEEYAYETKGIITEPEPTDEARQPTDISKSVRDTTTQKEDKSEGVKFYELDEKEDILPAGNDPVPQVTMPSFKKRVHSQRISQRERPAVTPYEGAYDEKYSSDEENVEYDVCEPEDLTERSNSTVTFSEDIYDSDAIDEMIRNQIRKPSQASQEGQMRGEDMQSLLDGSKPSKSILKDGKGRGNKKDGPSPGHGDILPPPSQSNITQIIVNPPEKMSEGAIAEEGTKTPDAAASGVNKKDEKGEDVTKPLQGVTDTVTGKETSMKGEKETVTKTLQSTIPLQIDQITDSSATNKHDFAESDEDFLKNLTKAPQETAVIRSRTVTEGVAQESSLTDDEDGAGIAQKGQKALETFSEDIQQKVSSVKVFAGSSHLVDVSSAQKGANLKVNDLRSEQGLPDKIFEPPAEQKSHTEFKAEEIEADQASDKGLLEETKAIPTRETALKTAVELLEDITKAVQEVFPEIPGEKPKEPASGSFESKTRSPEEWKTQNGGAKQLEDLTLRDTGQTSSPGIETTKSLEDFGGDKLDSVMKKELPAASDVVKVTPVLEKTEKMTKEVVHDAKEIISEITSPENLTQLPKVLEKEVERLQDAAKDNKTKSETPTVNGKIANGVAKTIPVAENNLQSIQTAAADIMSNISSVTTAGKDAQIVSDTSPKSTKDNSTQKDSKLADIVILESQNKAVKSERSMSPVTDSGVFKITESTIDESEEKKVEKSAKNGEESTSNVAKEEKDPKTDPESESRPRVIFRIDSSDDLQSDAEGETLPHSDPSSPTDQLTEKLKRELKESLERDQMAIEEKLTKGRIFDMTNESLSKTKALVDQRLRKISEIKPPQEIEEPIKKEKSPVRTEMVKIGRFHITPALVEEVISRTKEHEIAERLKMTRTDEGSQDEVEKELPEKLTEADLEEVIRELKKEGLKTDVYLQPEDPEKEEKKEKTLKRVERRFERMASETLEKDVEEGISEEKLNEKREIEFQRMVSNLSSEEVAEYQQEYLQLWEEGGLSSLTPTDDWESRDPDTPENELDDDSPRKSESFQGSQGTGETGEPTKSSEPKKFFKSPTSPPKPPRISSDLSPKGQQQPLTPIDLSHVGSSPSEIDQSSGFVSERSDDIPTYGERKKFWEQMSSSQSSETTSELPRSMAESVSSVESVEVDKAQKDDSREKISVKAAKQKFEKDGFEVRKLDEVGLVKSLTESYSKKIAAGEIVMPAIPRPKSSASKDSLVSETEQTETHKLPDSSDTAVVSELELKLKSKEPSAPITEEAVVSGSTELEKRTQEFAVQGKSQVEDVSLPLSERKKVFEGALQEKPALGKTARDRSMSLPAVELPIEAKMKKKHIEEAMRKEMIVEQIVTSGEERTTETTEKKRTPEIEEAATSAMTELLSKGVKIAEEALRNKEKTVIEKTSKVAEKVVKSIKETHLEKSEIEDTEKEKAKKTKKTEEEFIPSIMVTTAGKRQQETASVGESEDTQSESDVTPEEGRMVDNGEGQWEGSGTQSGGFSPKDDIDYPKEVREAGIGRWIGQEDLSKQIWEKDDIDTSHFKIQTKWERTRSEGASPKEHYVCTPEEHYPDTVWEVPVQEQLEKEEITHDIPIEKQVIIEKDEEEYEEDEEGKPKLTEEEAKEIAEEILEYIQFEVENRSSFLVNDDEAPEGISQAQVTDYLRHLTGGKEFDEQEVQLIESILKKQKSLWKSQSVDTTACSVDITDEELRSTGIDGSPVESQITKLEYLEEENLYDSSDRAAADEARRLKDVEIVDQTLAEVKESLEAAQETLIEQHKRKSEVIKKESPSEFEFKGISYDRKITEAITEQTSEWEHMKDSGKPKTEKKKSEDVVLDKEHLETVKTVTVTGDEKTEETAEDFLKQTTKRFLQEELKLTETEKVEKTVKDEERKTVDSQHIQSKTVSPEGTITDRQTAEKTDFDKMTKKVEEVLENVEEDGKRKERIGLQTEEKEIQETKTKDVVEKDSVVERGGEKIQKSSLEEKEETRESVREIGKTETKTVEEDVTSKSTKTEILKTDSKVLKSVVQTKESEEFKNLEISVPEIARKMGERLYSSEDSPRSTSLEDSMKSPPGGEEMLSSTSADKQGEKPDIVLRQSSLLKADRRSGADLEPYSSSGESHYHSFEQTSSRPCSSDVEALLAGNAATTCSSEYDSAMSHEVSSRQPTSTDYQTAVSSLSSRESIKSLDSESSGHLASVEVSSEASETLIPSALELDRDVEAPGTLDEDGFEMSRGRMSYVTQMSAPETVGRPVDEDFEIISESEVASWPGGVSDDEVVVAGEEAGEENAQKMKRSHEMTFQPEPKPIVFSESLDGFSKDGAVDKLPMGSVTDENSSMVSVPEERMGSSLEESGSVLSMSLSTTSEPSAVRTVIELSHTDSEKMDGSLTVSATSIDSTIREDVETVPQPQTNEMSTSTTVSSLRKKTESVTITTSSSDVHGVPCVSTQVTSVSRKSSMADEAKSDSESHEPGKPVNLSHANGPTQVEYVANYDEVETTKTKKPQGHRRKESTSSFVPTMMWNLSEARTQKLGADITETEEEYSSSKYVYDVTLTEKEVKNDEKKEADDLETYEGSEERKVSEGDDEFKDLDNNRPQSQISRTDSDSGRRPVSSVFSEDQADSELSELMKQGSSETEREDPLERPLSPEPEEMENKDITPEFSSEAQASVTELEMEYSGAYSRRDEYASHVSPIREERLDARFKETSEENVDVEKVPDGLHSQTSLESTIAEKHELESGEKEILQNKGEVPDITVTEHMTPVSHQKFQYPEPKEEAKERKGATKTPDTPASTSSRTSSSSLDGKEYNLDEAEIKKIPKDILMEEKEVNEMKDEKESPDSPSSDSFEMLDKPDISDEFVIIEEVGREAQENDQEGKSIEITSRKKKPGKRVKEEDVVLSPPAPATKMTDLRYYPSEEETDLFSFDSDSPPQPTTRKFVDKLRKRPSKEEKDELDYDQQIEQNKKWLETQFQGEQAAKIIGPYGYEMEFERAPLEDIKEEDLNELDSSSKIGSMGSQKESLGSFGSVSVKDSFSSTPDYDVLAGRKYFTRSGDHDDVSMSSLQEFELIEKKLMENGKKSGSSSSQDSLSSKKLGTSSKSGQGDDFSTGSLKEFETLENACATVVNMEKKAKQEEAILTEIDEGHESQISESESCETVSAVMKEKLEMDTEDFDKKMFEIDEIIRQAQSNVEKFSELQALEKIESIGRGDSYEEVAKVPDLELDMPLPGKSLEGTKQVKGGYTSYSTQVVTKKKVEEWRAAEKSEMQKSPSKPKEDSTKQSELLENGGKTKSVSVDSLEINAAEKQIIQEGKEETISLDSYRRKTQKTDRYGFSEITHKSDSMEEVSRHHEGSDYTSSGTEHTFRPPRRADFMLGSSDSLDPSSSTATHATYQYETDSVMSSSFTSGDSNTMVSSTDNLDLLVSGQSGLDFSGISRTGDWLENLEVGGANPFDQRQSEIQKVSFKGPDADRQLREYLENLPQEELVETEEVDEHGNVHIRKILKQRVVIRAGEAKKEKGSETTPDVYKRTEIGPEIQKIVFRGPEAEQELENYIKNLGEREKVEEIEEVDEHGNVHVKRILRQTVVVKPGETQLEAQKISLRGEDPEKALKDLAESLKDEVVETEEVGEDGTVHIKRVLTKRVVVRPEDLKAEELAAYEKQLGKGEIIQMGPQIQKVVFKGPNAEKDLEKFKKGLKPEEEVVEVEEIDEDGNIHVKKILQQRILIRPNEGLTEDDLQKYLEATDHSQFHEKTEKLPSEVQKITFRGPDAEKQFQEFIQQQYPQEEVEEVEEVDEHGNVRIKKIIRQRIVVRSDGGSTEEIKGKLIERAAMPPEMQSVTFKGPDAEKQFEEFMQQQQQPEVEEIEEMDEHGNIHIKKIIRQRIVVRPDEESGVAMPPEIQKIVFKGPDAEKQFQEFMEQQEQQPDVEEIEEVDEHGNVHIKKVLRQRIVVKSDGGLTEGVEREVIERVALPPEVQKITFKGPDAERQLEEFMQQQQQRQPEVEEVEEIDEHGNVHIKRIIKQRMVVRADQLPGYLEGTGHSTSRLLTEEEFQQYVEKLKESDIAQTEGQHGSRTGMRKLPEPQALSERLLTEEEFKDRLERHQTTFHSENIYIGSTAPFVSEVIEPLQEEGFSHIIHRKVQMVPEVQKVVFKGPKAEEALKAYVEALKPGEDFEEVEEVDEDGNVHVKRILRRKMVLRPEDVENTGLTGEELKAYLKQFEFEHFEGGEGPHAKPLDPNASTNKVLTEGFSSSVVLTEKDGREKEEKPEMESSSSSSAVRKESGISQRPPLVSDISMDDEAEYDTTEHDWRHQLEILHAEADEEEIEQKLDAALAGSYAPQKKK